MIQEKTLSAYPVGSVHRGTRSRDQLPHCLCRQRAVSHLNVCLGLNQYRESEETPGPRFTDIADHDPDPSIFLFFFGIRNILPVAPYYFAFEGWVD
jgi:hypothetical protein